MACNRCHRGLDEHTFNETTRTFACMETDCPDFIVASTEQARSAIYALPIKRDDLLLLIGVLEHAIAEGQMNLTAEEISGRYRGETISERFERELAIDHVAILRGYVDKMRKA